MEASHYPAFWATAGLLVTPFQTYYALHEFLKEIEDLWSVQDFVSSFLRLV